MLDDLDTLMGGRIAEELTFGEGGVSSGASDDMQRATDLAKSMVAQCGFSDKVRLIIQIYIHIYIYSYNHSCFI